MKQYNVNMISVALVLFLFSCKPSIETPRPSSGSADFSQYIAVGNSLTAGYADGGLYLEGQKAAFPVILAAQMKAAGGGAFLSPFFDVAQSNGSGYLKLTSINNGSPVLENVTTELAYRDADKHLTKYLEPIQNFGIPGMRLDLAFYAPFSALNIFFERLLPDGDVGKETYFEYASEREHTFFSFWLGNNDVLGYATAGGYVTPENAGTTQLTEKATFTVLYSNFINALTAKEQKGVVATIPDVTSTPFFTTVTIDGLLSAAKAAAPDNASQIIAIYIQDRTALGVAGLLPPGVRPATSEDLVVLPFLSSGLLGKPDASQIPYGLHPLNPVQDQYILDKAEVAQVRDYVKSYNESIKKIAESKGLALADVYAYFNQIKNGVMINGAEISATFISGGAFSLDGIHLTPKGNALIANVFIRAINETYHAKLSEVDINSYRGVKLP